LLGERRLSQTPGMGCIVKRMVQNREGRHLEQF
jgi:hypothetical protein